MAIKNIYFTDGHIREADLVAQSRDGITIKAYGKETFYPWHKIDHIGQQGDHLR